MSRFQESPSEFVAYKPLAESLNSTNLWLTNLRANLRTLLTPPLVVPMRKFYGGLLSGNIAEKPQTSLESDTPENEAPGFNISIDIAGAGAVGKAGGSASKWLFGVRP